MRRLDNMANKRGMDGHTQGGAGFIFSQGSGGLWDILDHVQAGKLYITGANECKASGTFELPWNVDTDPNFIGFTPRVNPSGAFYVSIVIGKDLL
jgi:hypothetical protein